MSSIMDKIKRSKPLRELFPDPVLPDKQRAIMEARYNAVIEIGIMMGAREWQSIVNVMDRIKADQEKIYLSPNVAEKDRTRALNIVEGLKIFQETLQSELALGDKLHKKLEEDRHARRERRKADADRGDTSSTERS